MDNFLIYLMQSFNIEAFEYLFNKYFKFSKIWAKEYIKTYGYNMDEFDYLENDLINNIYRAFESYDASKGVFYSYIKSTVYFTVMNYFRDYLKYNSNSYSLESEIEENLLLLDVLASEDNMSKIVERLYVIEEVENVIDRIELFKENEKEVIKLKIQGYSIDEISKMTGFNVRKVTYILEKFKKM